MKKYAVWLLIIILLPVLFAACRGDLGRGVDIRAGSVSADAGKTSADEPKEARVFEARPSDGEISIPDFGMKITLPKQVKDIPVYAVGYIRHDFAFINLCLTDEINPDNAGFVFGEIFAFPEKQPHSAMTGAISGLTEDMIEDLGTNGVLNYYAFRLDEVRKNSPDTIKELTKGLSGEQVQQYDALLEALPDIFGKAELTDVVLPVKAEEPIMNLTVQDLEGNEVRLGDMIARNKVTMLNAWGVTCGPCIMEMPYLAQLRNRYKEKGFEIIGLTADLLDEKGNIPQEHLDEAKLLAASLGVDYPVLAATREVLQLMKVIAVPTTWFVTDSGQVIGKAVMGARPADQWEQMINQALAAVE